MSENITVPGFGAQKKQTVLIVSGLVVVVFGIAYYRRKQASAAATPPTGPGIDQSTIDPATGFAYGSAQDAAALANQSGYIQPGDYTAGGYGNSSSTVTQTTGFTSNAQWMQAAEDYLANTVGVDSQTASSALGHYLAGVALSDTEQSIAQQAIGAEGLPPVGGVNGYPPSIRTAPPIATPTVTPQYVTVTVKGLHDGQMVKVSQVAAALHESTSQLLQLNPQYPSSTSEIMVGSRIRVK